MLAKIFTYVYIAYLHVKCIAQVTLQTEVAHQASCYHCVINVDCYSKKSHVVPLHQIIPSTNSTKVIRKSNWLFTAGQKIRIEKRKGLWSKGVLSKRPFSANACRKVVSVTLVYLDSVRHIYTFILHRGYARIQDNSGLVYLLRP